MTISVLNEGDLVHVTGGLCSEWPHADSSDWLNSCLPWLDCHRRSQFLLVSGVRPLIRAKCLLDPPHPCSPVISSVRSVLSFLALDSSLPSAPLRTSRDKSALKKYDVWPPATLLLDSVVSMEESKATSLRPSSQPRTKCT